ncbi:DNA-binding SARP family transcriptional activator [Aeromicrobium panaciterrae]|uniref:DNA-binding SARP family transcriptional activator n=1 Tax=Aeromicrobium panaciterrae TaxID=363861 RepID=A0ABU1UKU4_9ACTN|nr:BTAD domain-containing putative transcriptional regulator [Aeromicrobium panaciterrae]MDR7085774.1 DNA-binding SARP family transcriptional activator [Aeromicrobium panaciterrae]
MNDQTEIRLLGRLWIRLGNGTVVPSSQWTTGKTSDLLRLLAMSSDQIVSSKSIIAKLWPDVPDAKAAASLHTATAQIRKVLGKDSIMRHLSGLQLRGCWVDVAAHQQLGNDIAAAMRSRDFAGVVTAAKQAEALYVDDFHAHEDDSDWAADIRDDLLTQRKLMLADAAESAIELGWMRDAIEMSALAISLDACFERAHRSLMRAYAGIGETDSAMRSYERCRRNLKTNLNALPSSQTEALQRQLTKVDDENSRFSIYVGRERSVAQLSEAIRDSARGDGTSVVCVAGLPGSGRESLLEVAVGRVSGAHLRRVRPPKIARQAPATRMSPATGLIDVAVTGPIDLPPARAHAAIAEVLGTVPSQPGRVLVIVTTPEAAELLVEANESVYIPTVVESPPVTANELSQMAQAILAGSPSPDLVEILETRSEGLAGIAVEILRAWVSTGQVVSTIRGLGLVSDSLTSTVLPAASTTFRVLAERLEPLDLEICQVMAVLDKPTTASGVMEILGSERRTESRRIEIEAHMDHLATRGIFVVANDSFAFRDRTTQDLFELWLRPSLQARITERIEEQEVALTQSG